MITKQLAWNELIDKFEANPGMGRCYILDDDGYKTTFNDEYKISLLRYLEGLKFESSNSGGDLPLRESASGLDGKDFKPNPNFKQRCLEGEIVVNDYEVFSVIVTPKLSSRQVLSRVPHGYYWCINPHVYYVELIKQGLMQVRRSVRCRHPSTGAAVYRDFIKFSGSPWICLNWNLEDCIVYQVTVKHSTVLMEQAFGRTPQQYCHELLNLARGRDVNGPLVQQNIAKANSNDADVLTAIAESGQTFDSLMDGLRLILKITRDLKSRHFGLTAASLKRSSDLRRSHRNQGQFLSKKQFIAGGGVAKDYHPTRTSVLNAKSRSEADRLSKIWYDKYALSEAADAFTSTWLNYRYNITPLIKSTEGIANAMLYKLNRYFTYRGKLPRPFIDDERFVGSDVSKDYVFTKRWYHVEGDFNKIQNVLYANPLLTAWELIPLWSIIADWFFDISSVLKSINPYPTYRQSVTTYSNRIDVEGAIVLPEGEIRIKVNYYRRNILHNPSIHSFMIYPSTALSWTQKLDALSFLYMGAGKGKVKNYLIN